MRKIYLLSLCTVICTFLNSNLEAQTHFNPVGNFTNAMNINTFDVKVNGNNLIAGDEIGIFDGTVCVGTAVLTQELTGVPLLLPMAAGADDTDTQAKDGFVTSNQISFKMWDSSEDEEIENVTASFYDSQLNLISPSPGFEIGGTVYVTLAATHNYKPKANAGPDMTVNEKTQGLFLDGSGSSDLEGQSLNYSWQDIDNLGLNSTNVVNPSFDAPAVSSDTDFRIALIVNDGEKNSNPDTMIVTVSDVPQPPVANAGPDVVTNETESGHLNGSNSYDPDGLDLTYSWTIVPNDFAPSSPNNAESDFTAPQVSSDTEYLAILTVTNTNVLSDKDTTKITVINFNIPPEADAGIDKAVNEGITVNLDGSSSSDPDNGPSPITYQWTALNDGIVLNNATSATPNFESPWLLADSILQFKLLVFDGNKYSEPDTVNITVNHANLTPEADAGNDITTNEGETVNLNGSGSTDLDGSITFQWIAPDGISLSDAAAMSPSFTAPEVEKDTIYEFYLNVADDKLASDKDTVEVKVKQVNKKPFADAGDYQEVDENVQVTLIGSGSYDPDLLDNLSFTWTAPSGINLDDINSSAPSFTSPVVSSDWVDYEFQLIVSDGILSDTDKVVVRVIHENIPPDAVAGNDTIVNENTEGLLNGGNSSDPEGKTITYLWTAPDGFIIDNATSVSSTFTAPEVEQDTDYEIVLTVNDGVRTSKPDTLIVTVKHINKKPDANAGNDLFVDENVEVELDGSLSSDPDANDVISYVWNAPAGITLDDITAINPKFTTPWLLKDSVLLFTLVVNDGIINSEPDSVYVTVDHKNLQPTAIAGSDIQIDENIEGQLDGSSSTDPEGEALTYFWKTPDGFIIDNPTDVSSTFTAPEVEQDTDFEIVLTVDDGESENNSDTDTIIVTVNHINKAPEANAGNDFSVREQKQVSLDGSNSSDPDALDNILLNWTAPTGITLSDASSIAPSFVSPAVTQSAQFQFILEVTDGVGDSDKDTIIVTVTPNQQPVADAGTNQNVYSNNTVMLHGEGSTDLDDDILEFSWTAPEGISLSDPSSINPQFKAPDISSDITLTFTLEVTDDLGASSSDVVEVIVRSNRSPVVETELSVIVAEGDSVTLDATGTYDPDGDNLTYHWWIPSKEQSALIELDDEYSISPSFIAPGVDDTTIIEIWLIVYDGYGTETKIVEVTILDTENNIPMADAGDAITTISGGAGTLSGSNSSDLDGDILTYSWSSDLLLIEEPTLATTNFTAPSVESDTTVTAVLIVNDGLIDSEPDTVMITIKPTNTAPVFGELSNTLAELGYSFTSEITATDEDDLDKLTIYAENLPEWLLLTDNGDGTAMLLSDSIPRIDSLLGDITIDLSLTDGIDTVTNSFLINVSIMTGLDDNVLNTLKVYPNPTDGLVNIELKRLPEAETRLHIFNQLGQLIMMRKLNSQNTQIDLSSNPNGIYYLKISDGNTVKTEKLIIQ